MMDTNPTKGSISDPSETALGTVYGVLATLYEEPSRDLYEVLDNGALFEELDVLLEETDLAVAVPTIETTDDYELLCARFNDLFAVGYPDPVVPCYESEYVDRPWENVNLDLARAYDYFDVEVDQTVREHHDYLVIELEFAGYLSRLAATSEDQTIKRARADFLDRHLKPFLAGMETAIEDEPETGIYADVVSFTADFVRADYEHLRTRGEATVE